MIIVVTGKVQAIGKSSLIMKIIENLKSGVGVIKTSLQVDFDESLVTDDIQVLMVPGTDTARFLASGAEKVVFLKSSYAQLAPALQSAKKIVGDREYLIIEGNSVLDYLDPDLVIYLDRPDVTAKPSALQAKRRADLIIDSEELYTALKDQEEIPFRLQRDKISCVAAQLIAKTLGFSSGRFGKILDQQGIKLNHCQWGVF